jgi:hypothetical protein
MSQPLPFLPLFNSAEFSFQQGLIVEGSSLEIWLPLRPLLLRSFGIKDFGGILDSVFDSKGLARKVFICQRLGRFDR